MAGERAELRLVGNGSDSLTIGLPVVGAEEGGRVISSSFLRHRDSGSTTGWENKI
jgi:hypothetical protein